MLFVKEIYLISEWLPDDEKFGLKSQIQRAAVSIPSNIAEGASRSSEKEFKHYLEIALGSAFEVETQLLIINDLLLVDQNLSEEIFNLLSKIQKQLNALITKIKNNS